MRTVPVNQFRAFPGGLGANAFDIHRRIVLDEPGRRRGRRKGVPSVFFLGGEGLGYLA